MLSEFLIYRMVMIERSNVIQLSYGTSNFGYIFTNSGFFGHGLFFQTQMALTTGKLRDDNFQGLSALFYSIVEHCHYFSGLWLADYFLDSDPLI
jgi:hypothetical protein